MGRSTNKCVSISARFYTLLEAAARERGVTVAEIVERAVAPAIGLELRLTGIAPDYRRRKAR